MNPDHVHANPTTLFKLPSPLSNWLRSFLVRNGIFATILGFSVLSILFSCLVTSVIITLLGSRMDVVGLSVSILVPAIVAPLFSYIHLSMALELENLREEVRILAITDSLTQAYNRTYLVGITRREIEIARRSAQPLSLILMDVDDFKMINDTNGHLCGDEYLKKLCATCQKVIRAHDIFARYGGEEFIVLLPGLDSEDAQACAERIRDTVAHMQVECHQKTIQTTISLGVTTLSGKDYDLEDLFHKADQALYRAKGSGKNRVCVD